jgi:hypothetical protein
MPYRYYLHLTFDEACIGRRLEVDGDHVGRGAVSRIAYSRCCAVSPSSLPSLILQGLLTAQRGRLPGLHHCRVVVDELKQDAMATGVEASVLQTNCSVWRSLSSLYVAKD